MTNALIFILGLLVGSFLNAVIYRLHSGESVVNTRSHCPKCGHVLSWYELVPVFSYIFQLGRCRNCKNVISWQYPLVELATGGLFVLLFNFQFLIFKQFLIFEFLNTTYYFVIASLLIVIFVFDLKHYIIPDKIIYPAIVLALFYKVFEFLSLNNWDLIRNLKFEIRNLEALYIPLFIAIATSAVFAAIFFVSQGRWMGFGDVKLAFFMGLFLGWPAILPAIFLAFMLGGIIGIGFVLSHKKTLKSQVPFGPFLVTGTLISMFWGLDIINWYKGFIL